MCRRSAPKKRMYPGSRPSDSRPLRHSSSPERRSAGSTKRGTTFSFAPNSGKTSLNPLRACSEMVATRQALRNPLRECERKRRPRIHRTTRALPSGNNGLMSQRVSTDGTVQGKTSGRGDQRTSALETEDARPPVYTRPARGRFSGLRSFSAQNSVFHPFSRAASTSRRKTRPKECGGLSHTRASNAICMARSSHGGHDFRTRACPRIRSAEAGCKWCGPHFAFCD